MRKTATPIKRAEKESDEQAVRPPTEYSAEEGTNGLGERVWTILDVPILSEHTVAISPKEVIPIDRAWLEGAVTRAQERYAQDSYLGPVHVDHHGFTGKPAPAGKFLPRSVKLMLYEGKPKWTVFADLLEVPDSIYQKIKRGELVYRSVEINRPLSPEISTLALLADEVPYFRFPLLRIGSEQKSKAAEVTTRTDADSGILGYATNGERLSLLYAEASMAKKTKPEPKQNQTFSGDPVKLMEPEKKMEHPEEEKKQEEPAPEPTLQDVLDACSAMNAKLDQILEMYEGMEEPGEAPEGRAPAEAMEHKAQEREQKADLMARMMGRIEAAEGRIKNFEAERKAVDLAEKALVDLRGYALSDDAVERVRTLAREGGEKAVKVYVEAVKSHGAKEPGRSPEDEINARNLNDLPPEVQKFGNLGPDALDAAIRHYNDWKGQSIRLGSVTLERYLAAQFAAHKMGIFRPVIDDQKTDAASA